MLLEGTEGVPHDPVIPHGEELVLAFVLVFRISLGLRHGACDESSWVHGKLAIVLVLGKHYKLEIIN